MVGRWLVSLSLADYRWSHARFLLRRQFTPYAIGRAFTAVRLSSTTAIKLHLQTAAPKVCM